jgi:hypothetical protein
MGYALIINSFWTTDVYNESHTGDHSLAQSASTKIFAHTLPGVVSSLIFFYLIKRIEKKLIMKFSFKRKKVLYVFRDSVITVSDS